MSSEYDGSDWDCCDCDDDEYCDCECHEDEVTWETQYNDRGEEYMQVITGDVDGLDDE